MTAINITYDNQNLLIPCTQPFQSSRAHCPCLKFGFTYQRLIWMTKISKTLPCRLNDLATTAVITTWKVQKAAQHSSELWTRLNYPLGLPWSVIRLEWHHEQSARGSGSWVRSRPTKAREERHHLPEMVLVPIWRLSQNLVHLSITEHIWWKISAFFSILIFFYTTEQDRVIVQQGV